MRKYQIYSGAKPSSVNKTFAVNWGSKYFTVSPIAGKEGIRVSLNWFVTEEEVDQLVRFIGRVVEGLR